LDSLPQTAHQEQYQKALADFRAGKLEQAARELRPLDSAVARNALGVVLETMGDHGGAQAAFQDALRRQPDFAGAAHNAAKLLMRQGRTSAAISQLQSTLKGRRGDMTFSLQMLLAEAYAAEGQDKQAAETLEALLAERPDSAEVRFYLAITYASLDSLDLAVKHYREGLRLKPNDCMGLMGLAKTLLKMRKGSDATPYLQEYVGLRPNDGEGYYFLGRALRDTGRLKEAAETLLQASRLSPEDYWIRYQTGMALWRMGETEAARSQFEAAKRLKPDDVEAYTALARLLGSLGEDEAARKESEAANRLALRKTHKDQASYHIASGNVLLGQGDLRGAAEMFRQALELDPGNARARNNLGLVLARLNDRRGAEAELKRAIALDPKLPQAYNTLGICYSEEGHLPEAEGAFQQAIRANPQYAEAKNNLGTLYAKLGKNAEAVTLFEEAIEDSAQYPQPYLNWGLVLASQGDFSNAKAMLEKALRLAPNLAEAGKALQIVEGALKGQAAGASKRNPP
jgi:tetratricopeptide (TPR) repeat protein